MGRTMTLGEIGERSAIELLREVARLQEPLHVVLEDGEAINIEPSPPLKPLPQLEGTIPPGWKNAIYDYSDTED